jgi:polyphosphate kinase
VRDDVPLLERLRYLCIVSSNLDEFFEVRAEPHLTAMQAGDRKACTPCRPSSGFPPRCTPGGAPVHAVQRRADAGLQEARHIKIVSHGERNPAQPLGQDEYFEREVRPLLIPVGLDPSHPFPQVANKSLNFIVRLGGQGRLRSARTRLPSSRCRACCRA